MKTDYDLSGMVLYVYLRLDSMLQFRPLSPTSLTRLFLHLVCRTIDQQIILGDVSLSQLHNATGKRNFTPLNFNEAVQEGFVVGIDCEFVTLNQVTIASR